MADPNKIVSAGPNKVFKNRPTPEALGKKTGAAVFDMFKRGLGDAGMEALGAFAKPFAQGLTEHFTKIAQDKGIISAKDTQAVLARLRDLHSIDQFIAAPPAEVTHGNGLLDGRTYSIKETGEHGKYKAEGSITRADHAVSMVFDRLGLDMKGFGQDVADVLDFAGNAKKNLADKDSWITIVGRMAMAAFGAPGSAQSKLSAALNAGINSAAEIAAAPATDKLETKAQTAHMLGAGKSSGAGLAHTAPKTANTGSMSGAMAVRAALLSGLKDQDDAVERTAGKVLGQVMSHLGVLPDKATKKELHATLKKLMADKGSATGKTDPLRLLARTTEALAAQDPTSAVLHELAKMLEIEALQDPKFMPTPALQEAFGSLAASALTDLVAMKLGKEPPDTDKLSNEVLGSLRILLDEMKAPSATQAASKVAAEPAHENVEQPPVDISVWNCDRADLPEQLKSAALQFLTQNGIAADHPKSLPLTNALAEVLQSAVNPATGDVHPADFALQMQRWLAENAGASPKRFEGVQAMLSSTIQAHGKLAEIYQSTQQRYAQLQSQQAASTDRGNSTSLEKELEQLQGELARMGAALERGASKLERDIATLQQDAFQRMKEFIVDGKWAGDGTAAQTAAAGGGGGAAGGGGGVGGGGGIGGGGGGGGADGAEPAGGGHRRGRHNRARGMFHNDGASRYGNLAGVTSGRRPEDEFSQKNLTLQQQRVIVCGEILADPALPIEEKVFLFLMWFAAFVDQERVGKMEELVQMDREAARIQKLKDEKSTHLRQLEEAGTKDDARLAQATARVDALVQMGNPDPQELAAAQREVQACKDTSVQRQEAIAQVRAEVNDLTAKHDAAPKSREVLFMEIERLGQLKDKMMNMVRSMLETSNRQVEKIFR